MMFLKAPFGQFATIGAVVAGLERFARRAFVCAGPILWNKLPTNMRNNGYLPQFKKQLKTFLCST